MRKNVHNYPGMGLDYSEKVIVQLSMIKLIKKIFNDSPEYICSKCMITKHIGKWFNKERAINFYHSVAQFL